MIWSLTLCALSIVGLWLLRRFQPWAEHLRLRLAIVLLVVAGASGFVALILSQYPEQENIGRWLVGLLTLWVCLNAALAPTGYFMRHRTGRPASDFDL